MTKAKTLGGKFPSITEKLLMLIIAAKVPYLTWKCGGL
jgi:hypothetical protein